MPRLSFKPDASFYRKIVIGAIGSRGVSQHLNTLNHSMTELENGSTGTKIWKDVKRKRVRIPDLICIKCGIRVESRAKTKPELSMSHSATDAERAWDYGLVDNDIVAMPICTVKSENDWSSGDLSSGKSHWHSREWVDWEVEKCINYFLVDYFRKIPSGSSSTKGVSEGSETSISWDAIFSTRAGVVTYIDAARVSVKRDYDGHTYTWQNRNGLKVQVKKGTHVENYQILASNIPPLIENDLMCSQQMPNHHIMNLIKSPERTQRFSGIKLARLRNETDYEDLIKRDITHPDEDIYVKLEGAAYLASVCNWSEKDLFLPYIQNSDDQIRLEAVISLSEAATPGSVQLLSDLLDEKSLPPYLRSASAWALGRIGSEGAINRLIDAFSDVDLKIRENALEAVVAIGSPALESLINNLTINDANIIAGSAEAIRRQVNIPNSIIDKLIGKLNLNPDSVWITWLLAHLVDERDYITQELSKFQSTNPELHYAISVIWAFVDSWISNNWELNPNA